MGKTLYPIEQNPKPIGLVGGCFDPRFLKSFRVHTRKVLGLEPGDFINISRAGGVAALAHPIKQKYAAIDILKQIAFAIRRYPTIKTFVAYGHAKCGFYSEIPDHPDGEEKEKNDLPRIQDAICAKFPDLEVKCYFASFTDDSCAEISFGDEQQKYKATQNPRPTTITIEGFSPEIRIPTHNYSKDELGLRSGEFVSIQRAGGAVALAHTNKEWHASIDLLEQIEFAMRHFKTIERVFVFAYEGFSFYDYLEEDGNDKNDLLAIAKAIRGIFPSLEVECHFASFADASRAQVYFEKVV